MVDFFFVLSGFVISAGYANKINKLPDLFKFIIRRFNRLKFNYYWSGVAWIGAMIVAGLWNIDKDATIALVQYLTFTDVAFAKNLYRINPVAWSVMSEFFVYAIFAFAIIVIRNKNILILFTMLIFTLGITYLSHRYSNLNVMYGEGALIRAMTGFAIGSFCWQSYFYFKNPFLSKMGLIFVFLLAILLNYIGDNTDVFIFSISVAVLLFAAPLPAPSNAALDSFFRWLGDVSYPVYMWHFVIAVGMGKLLQKISGFDFAFFNGEKFLVVPASVGDFALVLVVVFSLIAASISLKLERKLSKFRSL